MQLTQLSELQAARDKYCADFFWKLLKDRGVPMEVIYTQHYRLSVLDLPHLALDRMVQIKCQCGWLGTVRCWQLTTNTVAALLREHALEIAEQWRPKLAEMTDWGWFEQEE
jgi:hypothetical protein